MNVSAYRLLYVACIIPFLFSTRLFAGQVVTDDLREWAKKTVTNEQNLQTAPHPNTVAVLYFQSTSAREELKPLQKGLALLLITDLSLVKELQVVERVRLQAITEEIGLGSSGLVEQGSAPRVGKLLGARRMVGGTIADTRQTAIQVQSNLLDVQTTAILGQPRTEGSLDELFRMEKDLLFDIVKLLDIKVTPELEAKLRKPCSVKPDAMIALFSGVNASDNREYEKAAEAYRKALKLDSNICIAGDALGELQALNLITGNKRSGNLLRSLRDTTSLTNTLTPKDEIRHLPNPNDLPRNTDTGININFP